MGAGMQNTNIPGDRYVLMIEDSNEDYQATARALSGAGLSSPVRRCADGDEALTFLNVRRGCHLPDLILLDLGLPGRNGRDVLEKIKKDENFKHIPVVVLSVSNDRSDIRLCYDRGASSYLHKPRKREEFGDIVTTLKSFWFDQAQLPDESGRM